MKKLLLQFILVLLFCTGTTTNMLLADTDIPGGDVSGTWTFDGSPYMVNGEITIPDGQTLTIEPGVEVIFTQHYKFIVQGQLLAIGTQELMITFTAQDFETGWHGLRFINIPVTNDSSKLVYCKVMHGIHEQSTPEEEAGGGISVRGSNKLLIAFCEIRSNKVIGDISSGGGGIVVADCSPHITQNWITNNEAEGGHGGGIALVENASPVITNNVFIDNTAFGGGGVVVSDCDPVFINNTFVRNTAAHGGGVDIIHGSPTFINTIIYGDSAGFGNEIHLVADDGLDYAANFLYCDIAGGADAIANTDCPNCIGIYDDNNIDIIPSINPILPDGFWLTQYSPVIEAGIDQIEVNGIWYQAPATDFYGLPRPRPSGTMPDIGAAEYGFIIGIGRIEDRERTMLLQNYPNPVSMETWIPYYLNRSAPVTIELSDLLGQRITTLTESYQSSGEHFVTWNTTGFSDGIYICTMKVEGIIDSKKIIVQR